MSGDVGQMAVAQGSSTAKLDLTWMSATQIRQLIGDRVVTPSEVLEHFLARIRELEPTLHAFHFIDEEWARAQAAEATRAVEAGEPLGPLHGVPTAAVDLCLVAGVPNLAWGMESATVDDIPIERIRQAGAVFVGGLNSYFWDPKDRPRNPWNVELEPGNSSRGSAIAVAAGMLPVSIGMDGLGSTRLPAAWSGTVGLHPSRGLVPFAHYQKPALNVLKSWGPLARDARDTALLLQIMAGPDGRDVTCRMETPPDYSANLDSGVDGLRIAWTDDYGYSRRFWLDGSEALTSFARDAVFGMADHGAIVEETSEVWEHYIPAFNALAEIYTNFLTAPGHFMDAHAEREAANDEMWGVSTATDIVLPEDPGWEDPYRGAVESRKRNWDSFARVFEDHDVLISTTTPLPQQTLAEWGLMCRHHLYGGYTVHSGFHNHLGLPAASVPVGLHNGLPVGVQVTAPSGREDLILQVVQAIQDANPITERPPTAL